MSKPHRGRIQAQGKGLEKSVSWSQDEPLTRKQGKTLLQQLKALLTAPEQEERTEQLEKAERYIDNTTGIEAPEKRRFLNRKTKDVRIDIEVLAGRAFVTLLFFAILYFILT